jgi:hypothetical protein
MGEVGNAALLAAMNVGENRGTVRRRDLKGYEQNSDQVHVGVRVLQS